MNDKSTELEFRLRKAEARIEFLTQKLDETRRAFRLSSLIDDQVISINARSHQRGGDAA